MFLLFYGVLVSIFALLVLWIVVNFVEVEMCWHNQQAFQYV